MFLLFILAGMLLAFGIYLLIARIRFIKSAYVTEAVVIDRYIEKADADSENTDTLHLTYKFYNSNNEEVIYKEEMAVTERWQIGDKATIAYKTRDPQLYDPNHVVFLDYWGSFGEVIFIFSVVLILTIVAAGYYWMEYFFTNL